MNDNRTDAEKQADWDEWFAHRDEMQPRDWVFLLICFVCVTAFLAAGFLLGGVNG